MSVGFTNAVADGLRFNSVPVSFEPGWERQGNGLTFTDGRPKGFLVHHTGAALGSGLSVLIHGRPDLSGPLCNACGYPDGRIHIVAAHPANHAGASGGRSMGPLPVTRLFNREVWGLEIMYPGVTPMTPEQYRSARVLGAVVCGILGVSIEHVRAHAETSVTGKWDIGAGIGPGKSFPMDQFRAETWNALVTPVQRKDSGMVWRLDRTKIPIVNPSNEPNANWSAIEDVVALPGPSGGWNGRIMCHVVFGWRGAWVQEAWWGPAGLPIVAKDKPRHVPPFATQIWEAPKDARFLVIRYAAPNGGSIGIECER